MNARWMRNRARVSRRLSTLAVGLPVVGLVVVLTAMSTPAIAEPFSPTESPCAQYGVACAAGPSTGLLAPTGVQVNPRDTLAAVWWTGVPGTDYAIELSEDPSFTSLLSDDVHVGWSGIVDGLTYSHTYYVRVTGVAPDGTHGTPSDVVSFTTQAPPYTMPTPDVRLASETTTSVRASWASFAGKHRFSAQASETADFANPKTVNVKAATAEFTGLGVAKKYYVRVREVDASGAALSEWSPAEAVTTLADVPLRVASYNVLCKNCKGGANSWANRRSAVAANIKGVQPDIIGVQEASHAKTTGPQLGQLLSSLGAPYQVTSFRKSGAGEAIIYNSHTVTMIKQGAVGLASKRYLVWGIFRQKATGKLVLVGSTHFEPGKSGGMNSVRTTEAHQVVSALKSVAAANSNLPTILVGDLNTYPGIKGGNTPYQVLAAEYLDPLGHASNPGVAKPETEIHSNYSSYNDFKRNPQKSRTYVDYMWVTPMRVQEWETVVHVDSSGQFIGTIPSDHNMIRADVFLP